MEQMSHDAGAEAYHDPDILQLYEAAEVRPNRTLGDLASMCPIDLDDPSISLDLKNEYAMKFINKAGIAIEPEHQPMFDNYLVKKQIQPNYAIKQPVEKMTVTKTIESSATTEKSSSATTAAAAELSKTSEPLPLRIETDSEQIWSRLESVDSVLRAAEEATYHLTARTVESKAMAITVEPPDGPVAIRPAPAERVAKSVTIQLEPPVKHRRQSGTVPVETVALPPQQLEQVAPMETLKRDAVATIVPLENETPQVEYKTILDDTAAVFESPTVTFEKTTVILPETELQPEGWHEPAETVATTFIDMLHVPVETVLVAVDQSEAFEQVAPPQTAIIIEAMVKRVSESTLAEQRTLQPLLAEIIEITTLLGGLPIESQDSEMFAMAYARLEVVYEQLCSQLQIECTPAERRQLVLQLTNLLPAVLKGDFTPPNIEKIGTREIKLFKLKPKDFVGTDSLLHRLLGMVALRPLSRLAAGW